MYDIIATLAAITRTPQFLAGVLFGGILSGVVWYAIGRCHGRIALAHKMKRNAPPIGRASLTL